MKSERAAPLTQTMKSAYVQIMSPLEIAAYKKVTSFPASVVMQILVRVCKEEPAVSPVLMMNPCSGFVSVIGHKQSVRHWVEVKFR